MTTENILRWFDQRSPHDHSEGCGWYPYALQQCQELATRSQIEIERVVYATAALSPMLKWETNIAATAAVIDGRTSFKGVFTSNIEKALHILHDAENWQQWLSGNKVTSFAANILGDPSIVTIDTWAWRVWQNAELRQRPPALNKIYFEIAADYREAAAIVKLQARQIQAVTWLTIRRLANGRAAAGQLSLPI